MIASKPVTLSDFLEYEYYIFDILGTTHNGTSIFPGVFDVFTWLKKNKKKTILLTNSPFKSDSIVNLLKTMNLDRKLYNSLLTSGDLFQNLLRGQWREKKMFFLNNDSHFAKVAPSCHGLEQATYIVIEEIFNDPGQVELFQNLLKQALTKNIPLICINPDLIAIRSDGIFPRPGIVAQWYQNMGGESILLGKPNPNIFIEALKCSPAEIPKTLIIGDTLETDVLGAELIGADSLLITHEGETFTTTANHYYHYPQISLDPLENLYDFMYQTLEIKHFLTIKKLPKPTYTIPSMFALAAMVTEKNATISAQGLQNSKSSSTTLHSSYTKL